jgi:hypothetical protein
MRAKPKRKGNFGPYLNGLVDSNCLSEKQAGDLNLKWSPANRRAELRLEVEKSSKWMEIQGYPPLTQEQIDETVTQLEQQEAFNEL